jgi:hypothetical protein
MKHEGKKKREAEAAVRWLLEASPCVPDVIGEKNYHRGKSQVVAGPGHSIAVTAKGKGGRILIQSFGGNSLGQLGVGNTEAQFRPCLIR